MKKDFFDGKVYLTNDKNLIKKMIKVAGEEAVETLYEHFYNDIPGGFFSMFWEYGDKEWLFDVMKKVWSGNFEEDYNDKDRCAYYASTVNAYNAVNTEGRAYLTNPIWGYNNDIDENMWYALDEDEELVEKIQGIKGYDRVIDHWYILGIADSIRQMFEDRYYELDKEEEAVIEA